MTNQDRIINILTTSGSMCDDCVSSSSNIKPRQSVNAECRNLERNGELKRHKDMCPQCKGVKIINQLQTANTDSNIQKKVTERAIKSSVTKDRAGYTEGKFPAGEMGKVVAYLAQQISTGELEIYNEFSLQHELGIVLKNALPQKLVQFERNISFFGFGKSGFVKKEIDIVIYDKDSRTVDAAIELKFPRNGQYPEQMYSFCKDVVFAEQLKKSGFNRTYVVIFAEDRLFYEGNTDGIYGFFRGGKKLSGNIPKPTGKGDDSLKIEGSYGVSWRDVHGPMKYTVIEAQ